jgi:hypothetical protein
MKTAVYWMDNLKMRIPVEEEMKCSSKAKAQKLVY